MKFYVDAEPHNLVIEARDIHHAMQRVGDIAFGASLVGGTGPTPMGPIDRVSTKPSRKIVYLEVQ